jgi:hypothetical protein
MGFKLREHTEDSLNEELIIREGLVLISNSLITRVIQQNHNKLTAGHTGVKKTIERITRTYTFPQLAKRVKKYVGNYDIY